MEIPRQPTATQDQGYGLKPDGAVDQAAEIPVLCGLCKTLMYGTIDQVGQELICPECGRAAVVPPLSASRKPIAPSPDSIGEYQLAGEVHHSADASASEQAEIPVICFRCSTRMYASADQVGGTMVCPDCGSVNIVKPPAVRPRNIDVMANAGKSYQMAAPDDSRSKNEERTPPSTDGPLSNYVGQHPELPRWPFLTGTFSFPFYPTARLYVMVLVVFQMMVFWSARGSVALGMIDNPATKFGSAMLCAVAAILATMCFCLASGVAMAIVRDTANGSDEVQNWPGLTFVDWLADPMYMFNGLCVGMLPGAGIMWLLATDAYPKIPWTLVSAFVILPVVVLSMLEGCSLFCLISSTVLRSFWRTPVGWAKFYLLSGILMVATVAMGYVAAIVMIYAGVNVGAIVFAAAFAISWTIYFRLLGRLA